MLQKMKSNSVAKWVQHINNGQKKQQKKTIATNYKMNP